MAATSTTATWPFLCSSNSFSQFLWFLLSISNLTNLRSPLVSLRCTPTHYSFPAWWKQKTLHFCLLQRRPRHKSLAPSKALTFISTKSIKAVELRKSIRSTSYLTIPPRPLSPLQQSDLSIFQSSAYFSPQYSSIFFQLSPLHSQYISTGWYSIVAPEPVSFN